MGWSLLHASTLPRFWSRGGAIVTLGLGVSAFAAVELGSALPVLGAATILSAMAFSRRDPGHIAATIDGDQELRRLRDAVGATGMGVWEWDMRTNQLHYSEACSTTLGYAPDEIESSLSAWGKLVHPADLNRVRRALDAHIEGRSDLYHVEVRLRARDGSWRWIVDRGHVVERDEDGQAVRAVGVHIDANLLRRSLNAANHSPWESGAHATTASKLLIVDDDSALLSIMETIATREGYEVVGANSFADAMTVLESNPDVRGLVTDYDLGGESGAHLADVARGLVPDLPVLLVSGTGPRPTDLDRVDGFLAKPFNMAEFARALRELLPGLPPDPDRDESSR